jgi:ubiquinone biosynthesis protein Coq4|tara:strand:- start:1456 stop:2244 length:789 start_codon:yes stop_codon:yes gene_type:complete
MSYRWLQLKFIWEYAGYLHLYDIPPLEIIYKFINVLDKKDIRSIYYKFSKTKTSQKVFETDIATLDKIKTGPFKEGTFGAEFKTFMNKEGAVDLFNFGKWGDKTEGKTNIKKFFKHSVLQHDLIHFFNDYDMSPMGEVGVLSFNLAKEWRESYATILYASFLMSIRNTFLPSKYPRDLPWYIAIKYSALVVFCRVVVEGWRRGKRAPWFMDVDWNKYLDVDLQQVKKELQLKEAPKYWLEVQPIWNRVMNNYTQENATINRT